MEQVEEICDDIVLIDRGRLVLSGNLKQIKRSMGRQVLKLSLEGNRDFWAKFPGCSFFLPGPIIWSSVWGTVLIPMKFSAPR